MVCCGTCDGYGCGDGCGGQGGFGATSGNEGVLYVPGSDKSVLIKKGKCQVLYEAPFMLGNGDFKICSREVGADECRRFCGSGSFSRQSGGRGKTLSLVVEMQQPRCQVIMPANFLYSMYGCDTYVSNLCPDSCCGPC